MISFVQVFQLHRLLIQKPSLAKDATKWLNNNVRSAEIVSMLTNDEQGLKTYLVNHFEANDISIINSLYDYAETVYYNELSTIRSTKACAPNNNASKYASIFWSASDLIVYTFKYLRLKSLNNCSFVCSVWMYHAFNPSCLNYYYHGNRNIIDNPSRTFQRLSNIQWLGTKYNTIWYSHKNTTLISSFKKLTVLTIDISSSLVPTLINSLKKIANQLRKINIESKSYATGMDNGPTVYLPQAQCVQFKHTSSHSISNSFFPIIISNQCRALSLENAIISHSWCEKVVKECTLSNDDHSVNYLSCLNVILMENVKIELSSINVAAKLFARTKYLRLDKIRMDMLKLWLGMKKSMTDNDTQVMILTTPEQTDQAISRSTLFQFMKKHALQCSGYLDIDLMSDDEYRIHPEIISVNQILQHSFYNIQWLTLLARSNINADFFQNHFHKLKYLNFNLLHPISIAIIVQILKFVDQQYENNRACFFHLEIEASMCELKPAVREYYMKLILTLAAKFISNKVMIYLNLKCVAVDSTLYSVVDDRSAKQAFTKTYNQLYASILKPLLNIKLDQNNSILGSTDVASYITQPQVSFQVENWSNHYKTWLQTLYVLKVSTAKTEKHNQVLLLEEPSTYWWDVWKQHV